MRTRSVLQCSCDNEFRLTNQDQTGSAQTHETLHVTLAHLTDRRWGLARKSDICRHYEQGIYFKEFYLMECDAV
jgi:hypothetical protein